MSESLDLPLQIRKFNPGTFQSDEEVIRQFVVRKPKLGIVMDILLGNVDSASCQHVLVVAPRGRGKSMLLARVAAEIRSDLELAERLLPLRFMEESQEIFNLADFWIESLFYLARESKAHDPELARELRDSHDDLAAGWRGEDLEERARATVLEAADRLGRKLVLMVENLQALCEHVDDDFGWKLRGALQSEPQIILLATATSRFKGLDDAREPFFELFRIIRLEPLDTGECRRLWQMVSGDAVSERGIRPLQILTGGSPRLLVIIGEFARHRSLHQLMEELVRLIDDHTEYFRGHLEVFAKTERRVYLAVIDLWQPSTTGEIAARARMDVRAVSALLGRLVERGAVFVEGAGRKRMYAATERLYSIYYKLRRERDEAAVVRNLIHFMAVFYSEDELEEWSRALTLEAAQWPTIREGIMRAIAELPQIGHIFSSKIFMGIEWRSEQTMTSDDMMIDQLLDRINTEGDKGRFDKVIEIVDQFFASRNADSSQMPDYSIFLMFLAKAAAFSELGETEAMIAVCNDVVERFGDHDSPMLQAGVARALTDRGYGYGQLGKAGAEIATWEEMLERFKNSDEPSLQVAVARALVSKGYRQGQLGETESEMMAYDEAVERFGDDTAPEIQVMIAVALANKIHRLSQLGEVEKVIVTSDTMVERFGDSSDPHLQEQVALALVWKGIERRKSGDAKAAIAAFEEVVERFGDIVVPAVQKQVADAMIRKADQEEELGTIEAAIATLEEVVERFEDSNEPSVQEEVAMALVNLGVARGRLGDAKAARAISEEVIERFGDSDAPRIKEAVAKALLNKGTAWNQVDETEAEITVYDRLIDRFGYSDVLELQAYVAWAMVRKANAQIQLGHLKQALGTCDELERKFGALIDDDEIAFG